MVVLLGGFLYGVLKYNNYNTGDDNGEGATEVISNKINLKAEITKNQLMKC